MTRPATRREGDRRLLRLAKILDGVPDEVMPDGKHRYWQGAYQHPCGAPSCALGHWAEANRKRWNLDPPHLKSKSKYPSTFGGCVAEFALRGNEDLDLFSISGCNNAQSGPEAAAFIRKFVANRTEKA